MASGHHHHVSQLQTANWFIPGDPCSVLFPGPRALPSVWYLRSVLRPPPADLQPLGFALVSVSYVVAAMFFLGVGVGVGGSALCPAGRVQGPLARHLPPPVPSGELPTCNPHGAANCRLCRPRTASLSVPAVLTLCGLGCYRSPATFIFSPTMLRLSVPPSKVGQGPVWPMLIAL